MSPIVDALALSPGITNPKAMPVFASTFPASPNAPQIPSNKQQTTSTTAITSNPSVTSHTTFSMPGVHYSLPNGRYFKPPFPFGITTCTARLLQAIDLACHQSKFWAQKVHNFSNSPMIILAQRGYKSSNPYQSPLPSHFPIIPCLGSSIKFHKSQTNNNNRVVRYGDDLDE